MLRTLFLQVHLYLGLITGLVIAVVCFTGAVLVFEEEIEHALNPEFYFVEAQPQRLPLKEVRTRLETSLPGDTVTSVTVYADPNRSLQFRSTEGARVFANPYTGAHLGTSVYRETFLYTVFALHRWLLAGDTGKLIVGTCTLLFLLILISGAWVWWPRNRNQLKARTRITRKRGWKRFNFDLHVSLGIYATVFLFIFAFTGLAWSFEWFHNGIYKVTGSEQIRTEPPLSVYPTDAHPVSWDTVLHQARTVIDDAPSYRISAPRDSVATFSVRALPEGAPHPQASSTIYLDQYTSEVLSVQHFADRNLGSRVRGTFYPVHVGTIFGWPTRILAFIACLLGATFPITGTLIWYNKRSKRWKSQWQKRKEKRESEA
ncbi:MAG: PepSY-associated TM helix domain-containing protein [Bacteroidota bacterium]